MTFYIFLSLLSLRSDLSILSAAQGPRLGQSRDSSSAMELLGKHCPGLSQSLEISGLPA